MKGSTLQLWRNATRLTLTLTQAQTLRVNRLRNNAQISVITVRNSSCGKVMFSLVSLCPGGRCTPLYAETHPGQTPPRLTPPRHPPPEMATAVDGTHPTGMHSCFGFVLQAPSSSSSSSFQNQGTSASAKSSSSSSQSGGTTHHPATSAPPAPHHHPPPQQYSYAQPLSNQVQYSVLGPINTKRKRERKRKRSKNKQIRSKNKRQTSKKIFAFAFAFSRSEHSCNSSPRNLHSPLFTAG